MRAVGDGQPMREAARRFDVAVTTVKRAVAQVRETGSLARKPTPGYPAPPQWAGAGGGGQEAGASLRADAQTHSRGAAVGSG